MKEHDACGVGFIVNLHNTKSHRIIQDEGGVVSLTLGFSRASQDLYQLTDREAFKQRIRETLLENPERYEDIRKVNLGVLDPDEKKRTELEIGKNLCGMSVKGE